MEWGGAAKNLSPQQAGASRLSGLKSQVSGVPMALYLHLPGCCLSCNSLSKEVALGSFLGSLRVNLSSTLWSFKPAAIFTLS